jgi:putative hydrolase of the HAD superfamily
LAPVAFLEKFPEVPRTLRELRRRGVRMAVVSDAWPELRGVPSIASLDQVLDFF